jgi:hypothetical protein
MRTRRPSRDVATACLALSLAAAACGGEDSRVTVSGPCDLADADMVMAVFEGTASPGEPGIARNCAFAISDGEVGFVDVYYFGPATEWDRIRTNFEESRDGITDVTGIGEAAFYPNDLGPAELVIRTTDIIFAISVFVILPPPPVGVEDDVLALAHAIIDASDL